MTDLEITKACAEAMGYSYMEHTEDGYIVSYEVQGRYDPLHDDAQAMALVKKFRMKTEFLEGIGWQVINTIQGGPGLNENLNRAICECVAKMRASK